MPRGDKSSYTGKQKRKAEHIEKGHEKRGVGKLACKDAPVINPIARICRRLQRDIAGKSRYSSRHPYRRVRHSR